METSSANTPAQSDGSIQDVSQQPAGNIGQSPVSSQPSTHQGKNILYYFILFSVKISSSSFSLFLSISFHNI